MDVSSPIFIFLSQEEINFSIKVDPDLGSPTIKIGFNSLYSLSIIFFFKLNSNNSLNSGTFFNQKLLFENLWVLF